MKNRIRKVYSYYTDYTNGTDDCLAVPGEGFDVLIGDRAHNRMRYVDAVGLFLAAGLPTMVSNSHLTKATKEMFESSVDRGLSYFPGAREARIYMTRPYSVCRDYDLLDRQVIYGKVRFPEGEDVEPIKELFDRCYVDGFPFISADSIVPRPRGDVRCVGFETITISGEGKGAHKDLQSNLKDQLLLYSDRGEGAMGLNKCSIFPENGGKYMEAEIEVGFYRTGTGKPLFVSASERHFDHAVKKVLEGD